MGNKSSCFADILKKTRLQLVEIKQIPVANIKCQYNPDRFKFWEKVCGSSLNINTGPFWYYLETGNTCKYFEVFRGYGRSNKWIIRNIIDFNSLIKDVKKNGIRELPLVLKKPLVKNDYNDGYEIFEGHRRLSIALHFNIRQKIKLCEVVNE